MSSDVYANAHAHVCVCEATAVGEVKASQQTEKGPSHGPPFFQASHPSLLQRSRVLSQVAKAAWLAGVSPRHMCRYGCMTLCLSPFKLLFSLQKSGWNTVKIIVQTIAILFNYSPNVICTIPPELGPYRGCWQLFTSAQICAVSAFSIRI